MGYNKISQVKSSELLPRQVDQIQHELEKSSSISTTQRNRLFHKLDSALKKYNALQKGADSISEFARAQILKNIEGLDQKIASLYGRIDNGYTDSQVRQIKNEAARLKKHLNTLCENYALRFEDRKVLASARASLLLASAVLEGKGAEEAAQQQQAADLYELAEMFQNGDEAAYPKFLQLPASVKERFLMHLRDVRPELSDPLEDYTATVQALVATANRLLA